MKVISLGANCDSAKFIKSHFSGEYYPFDWIWSNIDFVINTFEKDHFEFTDCEKLNGVLDRGNVYIFNNNCSGSSERICSAVSVHDSQSASLEEYNQKIPSINEKFQRRFKRLYDTLNSDENIFLVRRVLDKIQGAVKKDYDTNEKLNYLSELLQKKFKSNIKICVIDDENFIQKEPLNINIALFNNWSEMASYIKYLSQ